jgi:predicted RNA-binding Zn-ribbon protein involved in translation (DUF1610 family)
MKEPDFDCPECGSEIEYYDTAKDGKSGRYRCKNPDCGRDTIWAEAKITTWDEVVEELKQKVGGASEKICD